jgi:tetratricopeptide (TPR) repeat protein
MDLSLLENPFADELAQALDHHRHGRLSEAESLYRNILAHMPDHAEALHWYGFLAFQAGQWLNATQLIEKSLEINPNDVLTLIDLGTLYSHAGRHTDAEKVLRQAVQVDRNSAAAWSNLGSIQKMRGDFGGAEKSFVTALHLQPDLVDAMANLGGVLLELVRPDEGLDWCHKALEKDPKSVCALTNLAAIEIDKGRLDDAIAHAGEAIGIDQSYAVAHQNLAEALRQSNRLDEARRAINKALKWNPDGPTAHFCLGQILLGEGDDAAARKAFNQVLKLDPSHPDALLALGNMSFFSGDLHGFWVTYQQRWRSRNYKSPDRQFPSSRWAGQDLAGKNVLIWGEQGIGDEIFFAGLAPYAIAECGHCTLEVEPRLVSLFSRSFPEARVVPRMTPSHRDTRAENISLNLPIGDLPSRYRPSFEGFRPVGKYLVADPDRTASLRERYLDGRKELLVGISWHSAVAKRIPLGYWGPIFAIPGVRFVSLQYGERLDEIEAARRAFGVDILHDPEIDPLAEMDDFAAQVDAMDVVVSIDNSTVAVAAGLDKPILAMLPAMADWRYLEEDGRNLWHDCLHQFQPERPGEWTDVIVETAAALHTSINSEK